MHNYYTRFDTPSKQLQSYSKDELIAEIKEIANIELSKTDLFRFECELSSFAIPDYDSYSTELLDSMVDYNTFIIGILKKLELINC
jgi:hypothetical protein